MVAEISEARNAAIAHIQGGIPNLVSDSVWTIAFLMAFLISAIANGLLLRMNILHGRLFAFLGLGMAFSTIRCITMCLRLAWIYKTDDRYLAVVAAVFVAAGTVILYITNLFFAQRILRSLQPTIGWSKPARAFFAMWLLLIPPMMVLLITVLAQSLFTTDPETAKMDKTGQLVGIIYLLCLAATPLFIVMIAISLPTRQDQPQDHFGQGQYKTKVIIILTTSTLLTTNAAFKTATAFLPTQLLNGRLWWRDKWAFYVFNFALEAVVVYINLVCRVDQLFYVPKGCKKPGDYTARRMADVQRQSAVMEKRRSKNLQEISGAGREGEV